MESEKFKRGKEILDKLREGGSDRVIKNWQEFSPEMLNIIMEYIFG